jgi:hypothetical protein
LDRRLGGPQSWSERGGEEKNSQPLSELEPPIIQPVAQSYTSELSWLQKYEVENVDYESPYYVIYAILLLFPLS